MHHPMLKKEFLLSLSVKACNNVLVPEDVVPFVKFFGKFPSLCSFIEPEVRRTTSAERARITFTARKVMEEAKEQSKLKRSLKYQYTKMKGRIFLPGEKMLVRREEIVYTQISEFIGPLYTSSLS